MVPGQERSIAVGYFNVGSSIGGMIAPPLVVWAIVMHSWQMAFIITGVLSLIWAIAWLILYKHPKDQKDSATKNVSTSLAAKKHSTPLLMPKDVCDADYPQPSILGYCHPAFLGRTRLGDVQRVDSALHV